VVLPTLITFPQLHTKNHTAFLTKKLSLSELKTLFKTLVFHKLAVESALTQLELIRLLEPSVVCMEMIVLRETSSLYLSELVIALCSLALGIVSARGKREMWVSLYGDWRMIFFD